MVQLFLDGERLIFGMPGWRHDLKQRLEFPLSHVAGACADTFLARNWINRLRFMAVHVPGMLKPGTLFEDGDCVYWEVSDPAKTIIVYLEDEPYARLVVEVADPHAAARLIEDALSQMSQNS